MGSFRRVFTSMAALLVVATFAQPASGADGGPSIVSFEPTVAAPGSVVTVQGSGLDLSSGGALEVNGQLAQVAAGSGTELEFVVPTTVGSGLPVTPPPGPDPE